MSYENQISRGLILINRRCVMCNTNDENASHLFFTYAIATKIWKLTDLWIGRQ